MGIARDDARAKDRQALEANRLCRFFLQPHDPQVPDPALGGASHRREQSNCLIPPA
jgi:hypothetical protein